MKKILVVDDDRLIREVLRQTLEKAGYSVLTASNAEEGLEDCWKERTDLVITDLVMPGKGGLEFILELKRDFPSAKIIAISGGGFKGYDPQDIVRVAKNLGAERYFIKPFDPLKILKAIRELLSTGPESGQAQAC